MKGEKEKTVQRRSKVIDWPGVYRKIEASGAALERLNPKGEERKKILKERARALALEIHKKEEAGGSIEVVEFVLAYERYGVESSYVREIYPLSELTPVPCTPAFVLGIINVRGQILSIVDIKKLFGLPEKGLTDMNKVIILSSGEMEFGILADSIEGVREIPFSALEPALPTLTGIREEYLKGVTGERLVVLDAGRLLSDERIVVHEKVEA